MPSIIEGYNYDIFISYRQKDNKYDGWVTEFVDNLNKELEATFKEQVSVYFDINPSDYLLESYDVDASLKDKLKCLVFIPILSRTYCDPKSFAWVHEFKAFVEQASKDQYGLKIKLPNGNVTSRVLPVRIHDLDEADVKECESVLAGVLRGIEFIYKEAGIDKPLAPDDDEKKNLNHTKYRIQIIKVAHAIKEIILGMKAEPSRVAIEKDQPKESNKEIREDEKKTDLKQPVKESKIKLIIPTAVVVILIIAGILAYPRIFKRDTLERLIASGERIAVAVMPFQNMTNDTLWNVWQNGIQDILITYLSNSPEELKVRQPESINNLLQNRGFTNYASITPSIAGNISQKLDANVFIYGSIKQAGRTLRLNAQLVDTKTEETLKSFEIDGPAEEETLLQIADSLKRMVSNFLIISKLGKEHIELKKWISTTSSAEAFRYYIMGVNAWYNTDNKTAINWLNKSFAIDSNITMVMWWLSAANQNLGMIEEAKKWALKYYMKRDILSLRENLLACYQYEHFLRPNESIKYLFQLLDFDDQDPNVYSLLVYNYLLLDQYDKAIHEVEKWLQIYNNWDLKPPVGVGYAPNLIGNAYHKAGQYKKEKQFYRKIEQDSPDNIFLIYRQAILALSEDRTEDANEYIEKYKSLRREQGASEAAIAGNLAGIYYQSGIPDKEEEYCRQALSLESKSAGRVNNLAYFLIDSDRNVNEGLALIDSVLALKPDNYNYLHTKGWGFYKQGKYQEALDILQKSWDLRMQNAVYNHEAFLHLDAAKKAVAK